MEAWTELVPQHPAVQFLVLLVVAVWSTNALSKATLAQKFSGLAWIPNWLRRVSERTAKRELSERQELDELRDYAIYSARHNFIVESYAAEHGIDLPEPPFMSLTEWRKWRNTK